MASIPLLLHLLRHQLSRYQGMVKKYLTSLQTDRSVPQCGLYVLMVMAVPQYLTESPSRGTRSGWSLVTLLVGPSLSFVAFFRKTYDSKKTSDSDSTTKSNSAPISCSAEARRCGILRGRDVSRPTVDPPTFRAVLQCCLSVSVQSSEIRHSD
eukprot:GFYU01055500.1.p1 GENE.GFYU01055500.1~~GFYU01055500.1.p1  ORF type:complete len:153 (+),score=13.68 GFYU01055500.1:86-544(+)